MRKVKFKNIAIIFLFAVGVSSSVGAILYPKINNYFKNISPLPIVFSYIRNNKRVFYNAQFVVTTKSGDTIAKEFNKDLYRYLKGPHRRKIFLYSTLRWQRGLKSDSFKKTILSFCNLKFSKQVLKTDDLPDIITVGWTNTVKKTSLKCP